MAGKGLSEKSHLEPRERIDQSARRSEYLWGPISWKEPATWSTAEEGNLPSQEVFGRVDGGTSQVLIVMEGEKPAGSKPPADIKRNGDFTQAGGPECTPARGGGGRGAMRRRRDTGLLVGGCGEEED